MRFLTRFLTFWGLATLLLPATLVAAPDEKAESGLLVIRDARILTLAGRVIEKGSVVVDGGKIRSVDASVRVPEGATVLDAAGRTVAPGFIDVHSVLGLSPPASGAGRPTKRAADAFDPWDAELLSGALENGVTAAYLSTRGPTGIHGRGAIVRLEPRDDGALGRILVDEAALEVDLGSGLGALSRISAFNGIRKQLEGALRYREALETYETDLEEYLKKLEERAKKKAGEEAKKREKGGEPPPGGGAAPIPKPKPVDEKAAAGGKKPEEALKKPDRPRRNPQNEILLRTIDRKLPVRIEAHRSADILNALDLASEFSLDITLVGATEAHLVVKELAGLKPRVILEHRLRPELPEDDIYRRRLARNGAVLGGAGIPWWIGSGARSGAEARFVAWSAQLAAADCGLDDVLPLLTSRAAELLGVEDRIGCIRPGMLADLVIWSGDPRDPSSRVERVIVGGRTAYLQKERQEEVRK